MSNNDYLVLTADSDGTIQLVKNMSELDFGDVFALIFEPLNVFDSTVKLDVKITQSADSDLLEDHLLDLKFIDSSSNDVVYQFKGALIGDEDDLSSIVSKMMASGEFSNVELITDDAPFDEETDGYNAVGTLNRNSVRLNIPEFTRSVPNAYNLLVNQDAPATTLYMYFDGTNIETFSTMLRAANKLNVRFIVEIPPNITIEQAIDLTNSVDPQDFHVMWLWSPIVARRIGSTGQKGRKVPRTTGGIVLSKYVLRAAQLNAQGIPPIHVPIAGYDHPIRSNNLLGIEQAPNIVLDDAARKALAKAKINVVQRYASANGVRYIIGDVITAYDDNRSLLGLTNASDVSMYIDNTVIQLVQRHLLKPTENTIEDSTKACIKFLDSCTTKDRKLLTQSSEIGGYYSLSILPNEERPHDWIDVELYYHPQGATRVASLKTTVTK